MHTDNVLFVIYHIFIVESNNMLCVITIAEKNLYSDATGPNKVHVVRV